MLLGDVFFAPAYIRHCSTCRKKKDSTLHKILAILLLIVLSGMFHPVLDAASKRLTILQTTDIHGSIGDEKNKIACTYRNMSMQRR